MSWQSSAAWRRSNLNSDASIRAVGGTAVDESCPPAKGTMGAAVNRVKDRIAARSTILVGHSMGCRVITDAFKQSGATVSGLVFVDGSILGSDLESTMKSTKTAIDRAGMDAFTHQFFSDM